ncbi:hypothetical protein D7V86_07885 [bacterium D16-51]|nr:hypothetical protein D7V96_09380 [bacterium D16-59]RKI60751.1 hypothetical protein D7V86_07885 [bacterium D16-51]
MAGYNVAARNVAGGGEKQGHCVGSAFVDFIIFLMIWYKRKCGKITDASAYFLQFLKMNEKRVTRCLLLQLKILQRYVM